VRHPLLWDVYPLARAWVAPDTRRAVIDRKATKASDLNAVPLNQGITHRVQHGPHGQLGISVSQLAKAFG
jgi:hypothetical protein